MAWVARREDEPGAYAICYDPRDFKSFMRYETGKGAYVEECTEQEAIELMKERMAWTGKRSSS